MGWHVQQQLLWFLPHNLTIFQCWQILLTVIGYTSWCCKKKYWILFAFILGKYVILAGHFLQQPISHSIPTCRPHFQGSLIDSSPTLSFMDLTLIGLHWTGSEVFVSEWLKPIPNIFCVDDLDLDLHLRSTLVPPAFLHGFLLHLFSWLPWNGAFTWWPLQRLLSWYPLIFVT